MKRHLAIDSTPNPDAHIPSDPLATPSGELPNRLLTAFDVAKFVGCHEETVRRAYLRGLLTYTRFGVRGRRFHPRDVHDWIRRGAPTRIS
jgi:excisionase family DNA binding protein